MYVHTRFLFRINRLICIEGTGQSGSRSIHDCGAHRLCRVSCSDYSGKGKLKKCFQRLLFQILSPPSYWEAECMYKHVLSGIWLFDVFEVHSSRVYAF